MHVFFACVRVVDVDPSATSCSSCTAALGKSASQERRTRSETPTRSQETNTNKPTPTRNTAAESTQQHQRKQTQTTTPPQKAETNPNKKHPLKHQMKKTHTQPPTQPQKTKNLNHQHTNSRSSKETKNMNKLLSKARRITSPVTVVVRSRPFRRTARRRDPLLLPSVLTNSTGQTNGLPHRPRRRADSRAHGVPRRAPSHRL